MAYKKNSSHSEGNSQNIASVQSSDTERNEDNKKQTIDGFVMDENEKNSENSNIESELNKTGLKKAFMTYNQSNVNQKNFLFSENKENINIFDLLSKYSEKFNVPFNDVLAQYWVESMHNQVDFSNGKYTPLFSYVGAVGVSQVMKIAVADLNQKGILDIDGQKWEFSKAVNDPEYNIAAGIAYRKLIEDNYLVPNGIKPHIYNVEFMYLVGVTKGLDVLQKHGNNPHNYVDSLENILGKNAARDVKFYYDFTDMFIEVSENIKWPSSSYEVKLIDENGDMKGMNVYQEEDKNVYAMLDGVVTLAGEKPNNHGSMANGTWIKIKSNINKEYGDFQTAYIQMDKDSLSVKEGDKVRKGQIIGKASEKFGVYTTYGDVKSQNYPGARGYNLNIFSFFAKE
jgi:hypothetical protein